MSRIPESSHPAEITGSRSAVEDAEIMAGSYLNLKKASGTLLGRITGEKRCCREAAFCAVCQEGIVPARNKRSAGPESEYVLLGCCNKCLHKRCLERITSCKVDMFTEEQEEEYQRDEIERNFQNMNPSIEMIRRHVRSEEQRRVDSERRRTKRTRSAFLSNLIQQERFLKHHKRRLQSQASLLAAQASNMVRINTSMLGAIQKMSDSVEEQLDIVRANIIGLESDGVQPFCEQMVQCPYCRADLNEHNLYRGVCVIDN